MQSIFISCCLAIVSLATLSSGLAAEDSNRPLRLVVPNLVLGEWDCEIILYQRDGVFHHAYAVLPDRDNLSHPVDVTPTAPSYFAHKDGTRFAVPSEMMHGYAYKKPDFDKYKTQFKTGDLLIVPDRSKAPLLDIVDGKLRGTVDVLIYDAEYANGPGRGGSHLAYRLLLDVSIGGEGSASVWLYAENDFDFGAANPKRPLTISASWDESIWQPKAGNTLAEGADWRQQRGPYLNGMATPTGVELVDNLSDARLVWVAEDHIGGGRSGGLSRGGFAMYPIAWTNSGDATHSGVVVADGMVYQFISTVAESEAEMLQIPEVAANPYVLLGADPRALSNEPNIALRRDSVFAFDAATGERNWVFFSEESYSQVPESKSGRSMTVAWHDGKVYARGMGGIYCLDGKNGKLLWQRAKGDGAGYGIGGGSFGGDLSPVVIGDSLVMSVNADGSFVGLDLQTGEQRWLIKQLAELGTRPSHWRTPEGKDLVLLPSVMAKKKGDKSEVWAEGLYAFDAASGEQVWFSDALGHSPLGVVVSGDIAVGNGMRGLTGKKAEDAHRLAAVRLSATGAKRLWLNEQLVPPVRRAVMAANEKAFFIDDRAGFGVAERETGKTISFGPDIYALAGGSHNWTWLLTAHNRVITSGVVMFSGADEGVNLLPGKLPVDMASGYFVPVQPAVVDGRLFMRLGNRLVCYDLRKQDKPTQVLTLRAENAVQGLNPESDSALTLRVRIQDDQIIDISAAWPLLLKGENRVAAPDWLAPDRRAQYRPTKAKGLQWDGQHLSGTTIVRISHQHEIWTIDATMGADGQLSGTYKRSAGEVDDTQPKLSFVRDNAQGSVEMDGNKTIWQAYYGDASGRLADLSGQSDLQNNPSLPSLSLVVVTTEEGSVQQAWAASGKLNTAPWEVDPGDLQVVDGKLVGTCKVIIWDDQYLDINDTMAREQLRAEATATPMVIHYTVNWSNNNGKLAGSLAASIQADGGGWSHNGTLKGQLAPQDRSVTAAP